MLTEKQEQFCQHFALHRRGPAAYVASYDARDCSPATIVNEASKLLADPGITARIKELQDAATAAAPITFSIAEVLTRFIQIATADPNELVELKQGNCRHCHGLNHEYQWFAPDYVTAVADAARDGKLPPPIAGGLGFRTFDPPHPECPKCGGNGVPLTVLKPTANLSPGGRALYGGVKETKNGIEVIIADRSKALENVGRILGAFNDKLTHSGSLGLMGAVVHAAATDPHEAARMYEEMVKGRLT